MNEIETKETDAVEEGPQTKCGYAALIGRPNVGKSTLLNRILGTQVAIVTPKPQTTRNRILAVHNAGEAQVLFFDTPGLHSPTGSLGRFMIEAAGSAIAEADVAVWLIDPSSPRRPEGLTSEEQEIAAQLETIGCPFLVLLNKIDLIREKQLLLPLMEAVSGLAGLRQVIPISAEKGQGVDLFMTALVELLPQGAKLFPEDMLSDQAERFFVAELVREALTALTHQEVPYQAAVVVDKFVEEPKRCAIYATIHVEKTSQRGIVVGKGGQMIRAIGERARKAAEEFLNCKVELRLHVDVSPGWTRTVEGLRKMGYE